MELGFAHSPLGVPANQVHISEARVGYDDRKEEVAGLGKPRPSRPPRLAAYSSVIAHSFIHSSPDLANEWVFLK